MPTVVIYGGRGNSRRMVQDDGHGERIRLVESRIAKRTVVEGLRQWRWSRMRCWRIAGDVSGVFIPLDQRRWYRGSLLGPGAVEWGKS